MKIKLLALNHGKITGCPNVIVMVMAVDNTGNGAGVSCISACLI